MQVISTFLAYLRLERGAGANTLSSYEHDVRHFSGWLDAAQANARRTDLQRYISDSLDTEVISREDRCGRGSRFSMCLTVLHAADENDNPEMRGILRQLSTIQAEIGCGIGVVHHYNKADQGSMTQRLRGSSAIAGWAEWLIGISMADEETKTRRMELELKAAQPPDPIYYRIEHRYRD